MWTSRPGDGYISSDSFVMEHKTLHCLHLPGIHDHTAIADVLKDCVEGYHIDLTRNVTAFTTDNGSNVVKAIEEDLNCLRIPCAGHSFKPFCLCWTGSYAIKAAIERSKKVVTHFHKSRTDNEEFKKKQELAKHDLTQVCYDCIVYVHVLYMQYMY